MSDSNNNDRNPFTEDSGQDTIKSLVATATRTHRRSSEESTRKTPRYPSEVARVERRVSLDLEPEIKEALYALAEEVGGSKRRLSAVSQALIEYALRAYQEGRIELKPTVGPRRISFEAIEAESNRK